MILAGDVGGTKVALGLVEPRDGGFRVRRTARFDTSDFPDLASVVREFMGRERARRACFGVAAPVLRRPIAMTNIDWTLDGERLAELLELEEVTFINDLEAAALGIEALGPEGFEPLHSGVARGPTRVLVAAGTGLGMAVLADVGGEPLILPSEGGHQTFAPGSELENALLEYLRGRHPDHVSAERVVSGPGILSIYDFLRDSGRHEEPEWLAQRLAAAEDRGVEISRAALAGEAAICAAALELFARCYGAVAGDFALAALALRGVYLAGGIAPDILPVLRGGGFLEAFRAKGRMRELLAEVPVSVIVDPLMPLLGAARKATLPGFGTGPPG